jgi:Hypothetical protein (DUF2513)
MKRSPDLIRQLLFFVEALDCSGNDCDYLSIESYSQEEIFAHLNLLYDAGFIFGEFHKSKTGRLIMPLHVYDLTWKGHEYLDVIRDPKVWLEAKKYANKAGAFSVDVLGGIAKAIATEQLQKLGLPF